VVGAGPGGCAAALTLARLGVDVTVFERGLPGKDKPCGDALMPDAVADLLALGLTESFFGEWGGAAFDAIDLFDTVRRVWRIELGTRPGWVVRRAALDQVLRDLAAGACDLRYGTKIAGIDPSGVGWELEWRSPLGTGICRVDAVVIATGATGSFARAFGIDGSPRTGASVTAYARCDGVGSPLFQFLVEGVAGYGWVFPLADATVNIGLCAIGADAKRLRGLTSDYLERWRVDGAEGLRGGAGQLWSGRGRRWTDDRGIASCGDAAGLVDPITGEGVGPALASGRRAGQAIADFLASGDVVTLHAYDQWITATFGSLYRATTARRAWARLCQLEPIPDRRVMTI
jgi:flavin-dependent dehydrogenase